MSLTDEERRRLREVADEITRDDPRLARALSAGPARRPQLRLLLVAIALMVVPIPVVVVGAVTAQTLVVVAGCLALIVGPPMFVLIQLRWLPRT